MVVLEIIAEFFMEVIIEGLIGRLSRAIRKGYKTFIKRLTRRNPKSKKDYRTSK